MTGDPAEILPDAARRPMLIDTNILLLYFVGTVDRQLIPVFKRTATFAPEDYDTLLSLLRRFDRLLTTPHVLTEVSNFLDQVKGPRREECFAVFTAAIAGIEERYASSRSLATVDQFPVIGLTDTAILSAAEDCVVLTDDSTLYNFLLAKGAGVINFNHVRTLGWDP